MLVGGDAAAIAAAFSFALWRGGYAGRQGTKHALLAVIVAATVGVLLMRSQDLYLARVSMVRVVEITRTARAMTLLTCFFLLLDRILHSDLYIRNTLLATCLSFVLVYIARAIYRSRLAMSRERGGHQRRVVIVGTDDETMRLMNLFATHLDLGIVVVGIIGDRVEASSRGLTNLWLGDIDRTEALIGFLDVSGVVVSPATLPPGRLNELIRNMHARNCHVHLATGVAGIDARRMRSIPIAHEPLVYVEAPALSRVQLGIKRAFDIVVAGTALVALSPVMAMVALAIKLDDRGPVFFRQSRVGRHATSFGLLKFRSMQVDAEKQRADLANERNGPLFKMTRDPRVTRVGRFLRESSLDELPQLLNVLRGEMSLVGPRPALPAEVLNFPDDLRLREQVLPGITGLWQVEARDNPSFEAYRRLDLFYVENWSMTLDLTIVVGTIEHILGRVLHAVLPRRKPVAIRTTIEDRAIVETSMP